MYCIEQEGLNLELLLLPLRWKDQEVDLPHLDLEWNMNEEIRSGGYPDLTGMNYPALTEYHRKPNGWVDICDFRRRKFFIMR